ncbi:hypothetical protein OFN94_36030, partial [Escherichia coli]|nr:hypothetical protein [Escherichia coli]
NWQHLQVRLNKPHKKPLETASDNFISTTDFVCLFKYPEVDELGYHISQDKIVKSVFCKISTTSA